MPINLSGSAQIQFSQFDCSMGRHHNIDRGQRSDIVHPIDCIRNVRYEEIASHRDKAIRMRSRNKDHWEGVYSAKDDNSLSWFQQHTEPSLGLIRHHAQSKSARIVDVGAGTSRLVDELLDDGFSSITLVEISRSALDRTARRLGGKIERVTYIRADVTNWMPEDVWDIWHDRAVFHFLTETSDQDAYLETLRAGTASGSIVIIGTFALDGPEKCSGLPVQRYSAELLEARLGSDFKLLESMRCIHLTPAKKEQPFSFVVFRRR